MENQSLSIGRDTVCKDIMNMFKTAKKFNVCLESLAFDWEILIELPI